MNYKLRNCTKISNKTLHRVIEFVWPRGLSKVKIFIKYTSDEFSGVAYTDENRVSLRIKKRLKFPFCCGDRRLIRYGYTDMSMLKNTKEVLVSLCAHELAHLWQMNVSKQKFTKTKLHKFEYGGTKMECLYKMEKHSSEYAKRKLKQWRKHIKND